MGWWWGTSDRKLRNQLLALCCLLVFAAFGFLYVRTWVVPKTFGIILFVSDGMVVGHIRSEAPQPIARALLFAGLRGVWVPLCAHLGRAEDVRHHPLRERWDGGGAHPIGSSATNCSRSAVCWSSRRLGSFMCALGSCRRRSASSSS